MIEHNGKKYARVSDILRPFNDYSHINPDVLEKKRLIGSAVHEAIKEDIEEGFPSPSKEAMGYFTSYQKWKEALNPIVVQSEVRYYDDERMITGQIDALIQSSHPYSSLVLIDFKTSSVESKEVWPMQAHLYYYLLDKNGIVVHPCMLFIRLNKHGRLPEVHEYKYSINTNARCMAAIDSFWKSDSQLIDNNLPSC